MERTRQNTEFLNLEEQKEKVKGVPTVLIVPPSPFLTDQRVFPQLGILKVAAELRNNKNPVTVLDLSGYNNYPEIIREFCRSDNSVNYCFSATTPQIPFAAQVAQIVKEEKPEANLVLGGPHVTLAYSAYMRDMITGQTRRGTETFEQLKGYFNTLVAGDGEMAIFYAIDKNPRSIIDASSRKSPLFLKRGTLENFARPARDLIDLESYKYYIKEREGSFRATSVIAQLGCPFECGFCGGRNSDFLRLTRTRNVGDVIEEISEVVLASENWEEPIRGIMFYDDELNVSPGSLEELCIGLIEMQREMGVQMAFRGFVKAELFTKKQAELMYRAGFRVLLTGVESGSDEILTAMKKHTTRDINSRCVKLAHDAGLSVKFLMSIGHPGETRNTINESVKWVLANYREGDDVDWTVITQFPGSKYFDDSIYVPSEDAWLYIAHNGSRLWSKQVDYIHEATYYKGIPGEYTAYVWTDELSPDDLVSLRDEAESITRSIMGLPNIMSVEPNPFEHSMGQGLPPQILKTSP